MLRDNLLLVVAASVFSACSGATPSLAPDVTPESGGPGQPPAHVRGFWKDQDHDGYLLGFEGHRMLVWENGQLEVTKLLNVSSESISLCRSGREQVWPIRREGESLMLEDSERDEAHRLQRLPKQPSELTLAPLALPAPMALPMETIRDVQKELSSRLESDQEFRRPLPRKKVFREAPPVPPWFEERSEAGQQPGARSVDMLVAARSTQNTEYIIELVSRIGWVDAERFDYGTSNAAFLLVQHSWNLPLMLGVLPWIERDVKAGRVGEESYALLFDRLQLSLGERQRYGTQVLREGAEVVVLPVEDPSHVDALRQEAGMIPLERYVKLFGGTEVRFSTECGD